MKEIRVLIFKTGFEQKWGLSYDSEILEQALKDCGSLLIQHLDPHTAHIPFADVAFHLDVPCRLAIPNVRKHYFFVNPEQWYKNEWHWCEKVSNATFIFRYSISAEEMNRFPNSIILPWRLPVTLEEVQVDIKRKRQFVAFLGASKNKLSAMKSVLREWKACYPPLLIWSTKEAVEELKLLSQEMTNVILCSDYLTTEEMLHTLNISEFSVCVSEGERFGYALGESMKMGALPLWSTLPAFELFAKSLLCSVGALECMDANKNDEFLEGNRKVSISRLDVTIQSLLDLTETDRKRLRKKMMKLIGEKTLIFRKSMHGLWNSMITDLSKIIVKPPCRLMTETIPLIGVVTLTYNRPHWMKLAFHNILQQSLPQERFVWIIVDDGVPERRTDQQVMLFREKNPSLKIEYVSLPKRIHIGAKRNRAIRQALAQYPQIEYFAMMDDDDVYFKHSLRDRIAWIQSAEKETKASYCSILPMYDLRSYTSGINVPPLNLSPAKRCSEASMAFTTAFWKERQFPDKVSIAEGEEFFAGREEQTIEISPQGIIVSLLHGQNTSGRRIRDNENKQNGCHFGFSDDFFVFLHELGIVSDRLGASLPKEVNNVEENVVQSDVKPAVFLVESLPLSTTQ